MLSGSHYVSTECISNIDILQRKYKITGRVLDVTSGLHMERSKAMYAKK
jgi:hypothetical protein